MEDEENVGESTNISAVVVIFLNLSERTVQIAIQMFFHENIPTRKK